MSNSAEYKVRTLLEGCGVQIGGHNDWDPIVHNPLTYDMVIAQGTLGVGDSYELGYWDCNRIDILVEKVGTLHAPIKRLGILSIAKLALEQVIQNMQAIDRAKANAEYHYSVGNDFYEAMLGQTMAYSCAYFRDGDVVKADNLDEAQKAKFDLICRKLKLEPGMSFLDIGCGWGGLLDYAVKNYEVKATGISPATEQVRYIKDNKLDIDVRQIDYRELKGEKFDAIASVGMFEHVGVKNYYDHFKKVSSLLEKGGRFLLHTITAPHRRIFTDPYVSKRIFPGGHIPARSQIKQSSNDFLGILDIHELGPNYDPTLLQWTENLRRHWPALKKLVDEQGNRKYSNRLFRRYEYQNMSSAGTFRNGVNQLTQTLFVHHGSNGPPEVIR